MHVEPKPLVLSHFLLQFLPLTLELYFFFFAHVLHVDVFIYLFELACNQTFYVLKRQTHFFLAFKLALEMVFYVDSCIPTLVRTSVMIFWLQLSKRNCTSSLIWWFQLNSFFIFKRNCSHFWSSWSIVIISEIVLDIVSIVILRIAHIIMVVDYLETSRFVNVREGGCKVASK